jgi:flagellar biosynthesis protein FlhB
MNKLRNPYNYPFLIVLMLLTATAVTLAIGDEQLAETLTIYAYYFLVIGIAIRFFELSLPEDTLQRLNPEKDRISFFSDFKRQYPPEMIVMRIREMISDLNRQFKKLRRPHIVNPGKNIALISEISINVAIFLSVFFIFSLVYGITIDWWFVRGYFHNLIFAILGFLTLYMILRVRF